VEDAQGDMENSFEQAFGWFAVINRIAGDDFTKHDQITKAPILAALNQLLYILEKEKEIIRRQKQTNSGV
jgi:hypothetical protein